MFARMKRSLGAAEWVRKILGVLVLIGVAAIALGLDTRVLSKLSSAQTSSFETGLARTLGVGTGGATLDQLREHQPTAVVKNLADTAAVLGLLLR